MQSLLDTINWQNPFSDHKEVQLAHRVRVENSARRLEIDSQARSALLDHPDFYAYLLELIRGSKPNAERLSEIFNNTPHARLANGIPLFFKGEDAADYSLDEQAILLTQIEDALTELKATVPKAYNFVTDITRMIVCRNRPALKHFFTSSQISHLGRVTLDNALGVPRIKMMEGLVHESVHGYLYMIEEKGRLLSTNGDPRTFVLSPWTSNRICIHSFVHACFVWYSLSTLPGMDESYLQFIRRGFARKAFEEIVVRYPDLIGSNLKDLLMNIREMTLAAG